MGEEKFLCFINKREFNNKQIFLKRPTILRAFQKIDGEMRICERLKYLQIPELNSYPLHINTEKIDEDVSTGPHRRMYELYIREEDLCNKSLVPVNRIKLFTQRRVLTNIFVAPYSTSKFTVIAKRHGNMIFMTMERKIKYLGDVLGFSRMCKRDSPNVQSNDGEHFHDCEMDEENNLGYMIFGTKVSNFDIIYSNIATPVLSEEVIENVANTDVLNKCSFVLPKLMNTRKERYWMKTISALKWWHQCYVSAITNIFIGFIDDQSFIRKPAKLYKVDSIWEAQSKRIKVCQAFLIKFLKLIEETTKDDDPWDMIYNFNFDGKGNVTYSMERREPESIIFSADFAEYIQNQ